MARHSGRNLERWGLERTAATRMLDAQLNDIATWNDPEAFHACTFRIRRAGYVIRRYRLPSTGRDTRYAYVVYDVRNTEEGSL